MTHHVPDQETHRRAAKRTHGDTSPATPGAQGATDAADGDDSQSRHDMIALAAYYRAERRGFGEGEADTDWLEAEREVDGTRSAVGPDTVS